VSVSQRGHGDSDKPDGGYRVEDFAADVVSVLDACAIERAGLARALRLVSRCAADCTRSSGSDRRLVLEASPTTLRDDARLIDFVERVVSNLEDPINLDIARSFIADTSAAGIDPDLADLLVEELLKVPAHVWRGTFSGLLRYDDTSELGRGDADGLVSREMQDRLLRSIPAARRGHAALRGSGAVQP